MTKTLETAVTTDGQTLRKIRDSAGRVQYLVDGTQVKQQTYAGKKAHTPDVEYFKMGHLADSVDSVEDLGPPFDAKTTVPAIDTLPEGSEERHKAAEVNRWLGFKFDRNTPDDPLEAAKEYTEMVKELRKYDSVEKRQEVRERYNIGGS